MIHCLSSDSLNTVIEDRAFGALLGLAVGNALGTTLEFSERDTHSPVIDMVGGGPFHLRPGEWTDDTSIALCLADSLIACKGLDEHDLLDRFARWFQNGENSVNGRCFDIGITTRQSLDNFIRRRVNAGEGPHDVRQAGNGTIMRLAPAAIFSAPDAIAAQQMAERQSLTTHANAVAAEASGLFVQMLVEAICGADKPDVLRSRATAHADLTGVAAGHWRGKSRDEISSSGYVVHTLEAALWCVARTSNFADALILAVNLADDSDTVGAVTGQLAGALYGRSGIPASWLNVLAWRDHIEQRALALLSTGADTWWRDVLHDRTLLIGIRKYRMDIYWQGQAIFNVSFSSEKVAVSTHVKYLLDPSVSTQVSLSADGAFASTVDPILRSYAGNETLQKLKKAAALFSGEEKQGVHSIACTNDNVIDVEVALDARELETARNLPRIDIAALEKRAGHIELVFWGAKLFQNKELRSRDAEAHVAKQMSEYQTVLNAHRGDVIASYKRVAENLVAIEKMSAGARKYGEAIHSVAGGDGPTMSETPEVGLLIFGFDADQRGGDVWKKHFDKLAKDKPFPVIARGDAKGIRL